MNCAILGEVMSRGSIRLICLIKSFVTKLNRVNTRGDLLSLFSQVFGKIFLNVLIASAFVACDAKFKMGNTPGPGQSGPAPPAAPVFVGLSISNGAIYDYGGVVAGGGISSHTFTVTNNEGNIATLGTVTTVGLGLAAPYTLTGGTCTTGALIAPAATCTLIVTYTPVALTTTISGISLQYTMTASYTASRPIMGTGATAASLTVSDAATYDYGTIALGGGTASHTFTVSNGAGLATATLGSVNTTANLGLGATKYTRTGGTCADNGAIAGGASCTIIVTYTPTAAMVDTGTISVSYNDGVGAQSATRPVTGTGANVAVLTVSDAATYDYGNVAIGGGSAVHTFTVSNGAGLATATLGSVNTTTNIGLNGTKYARTGGTCADSGTLAGGASCTIIVTYTPTALGVNNGTISVSYNDGIAAQTATRPVTGTGANVASLTISDATTYDYGLIAIGGGSAVHTFTISNGAGLAPATLSTVNTTANIGLSGTKYTRTGGTCADSAVILASGSCTIQVTFTPTALGVATGTITVNYNNGTGATSATRPLTGTGANVALLTISDGATYDYGNVAIGGGSAVHTFTVSNGAGLASATLSTVNTTANLGLGATKYTRTGGTCADSGVIAASGSCTIQITFTPTAMGATTGTITLNYNDGTAATSTTRDLTGTGTAAASLTISDGATYDYGNVAIGGGTAVHTFTVSNAAGLAPATLSTVNTTTNLGLNGTKYTRTGGTCADSGVIAAGGSCTIQVTFTPTALGAATATITVNYNDGTGATSATRPLTGTGVNAASLTISDAATYDYGYIAIGGGTGVHTFTVSNGAGLASATLSTVNTTANIGLSATKYTRTGGTCADSGVIAAGGSCTIQVTFTPTALGAATGTITLNYNDGTGSTSATRPLTGTGANVASLTISDATTYDYGTVSVGNTPTHTFTVSNGAGLASATLETVNTSANLGLTGTKYTRSGGTCADSGVIAASGSCTIIITYTPTVTAVDTATLSVSYNNSITAAQTTTRAITGTGSGTIVPLWTTDGTVMATALVGSTLYIGGDFTQIMASTNYGTIIDTSSGYPLAGTWGFSNQISGQVNTAVSDGSGGYFIAGSFTWIGPVARNYAAHILSDGSLDSSWNPNFNGVVRALAYDSTNHVIYVGGNFTLVNGATAAQFITAVNDTTGTATGWAPVDLPDASVAALLINADTLYVGGDFTLSGITTTKYLTSYKLTTASLAGWAPNVPGGTTNARALIVDSTGNNILVGFLAGNFSGCYKISDSSDCAWNPKTNEAIFAMARSGTTVYIGGQFTKLNPGMVVVTGIAAVDDTNGDIVGGGAFNPSLDIAVVNALAVSGGKLYAGGDFYSINGFKHNGVAELDLTTGAPLAGSKYYTEDLGGVMSIKTVAVSGTKLYVGGHFTHVGNWASDRNNLAAINVATGLPTSWNPNPDDYIFSMTYDNSSKLYVGGRFTNISGVARGGVASYTTSNGTITSWNPNAVAPYTIESIAIDSSTAYIGGTHLGMNGTNGLAAYFSAVDTTTGTVVNASNFVANNEVKAVDYDSNYIYLLGTFTNGSNSGPVVRVDKVTKNADMTWPNVALLYDSANTLKVVGSNVVMEGVIHLGTDEIDAVKSDGTAAWTIPVDSAVYNIGYFSSKILYAGQFVNVNGGALTRYRVMYSDTNGAVNAWAPILGSSALSAAYSNGKYIVAGGTCYVYSASSGGYFGTVYALDATGNPL